MQITQRQDVGADVHVENLNRFVRTGAEHEIWTENIQFTIFANLKIYDVCNIIESDEQTRSMFDEDNPRIFPCTYLDRERKWGFELSHLQLVVMNLHILIYYAAHVD